MTKFKKINEKNIKLEEKNSGFKKKFIVKQFKLPNNLEETFFIDKTKSSVVVFAITEDSEVLCVKQFRPATEILEIELPGGGLEENEKPLEACLRELKEEVGAEPEKTIYLGETQYNPYSTGKRYMFAALNCKTSNKQNLDPNEYLTVEKLNLSKVIDMALECKIRDWQVVLLALNKLKELK